MKNTECVNREETVFIPKTDKNDEAQFVAVNGRRMLIRKGEAVAVPPAFAEVLRHSGEAAQEAERYISTVSGG